MGSRGPKPKTFQRWLHSVAPLSLIIETDEGDEKRVKVPFAKTGLPKYKLLTDTVSAMGPSKATALDKDGAILGVWAFPELDAKAPGYTADLADDRDTRMLKVFAHLLSDAHSKSQDRLVQVVDIQARNMADERKAFSSTLMSMDRVTQRLARQYARLRGQEADDGEGGREVEDENPVADMIKQAMLTKMGAAGATAPAPAPAPNGKATKS